MKPVIVISCGDVNGIGPEILIKTLSTLKHDAVELLLTGDFDCLQWWNQRLGAPLSLVRITDPSETLDPKESSVRIWSSIKSSGYIPEPGFVSATSGEIALQAIRDAVSLCVDGLASALVTSPINKEAINLAGSIHPGHTEYLAELSGIPTDQVMMVLAGENLNVGLVTIHEPLSNVTDLVTTASIRWHLDMLHHALVHQFGIPNPVIDVMGLNPHAGDGGVIGTEEQTIIEPALTQSRAAGMNVQGPYPADAYFGMKKWVTSDAVLAMYHDQGLIPFKMLEFETGVNMTLGLPFVRTSPDHGTAFDIADKGIANPSSFIHAVNLAIQLTSR